MLNRLSRGPRIGPGHSLQVTLPEIVRFKMRRFGAGIRADVAAVVLDDAQLGLRNIVQVTCGAIVSCKFVRLSASMFANSTVVLLRRLRLPRVAMLLCFDLVRRILFESELDFAITFFEAFRIPSTFKLIIVGHVHPILLFHLGSDELELLVEEIKVAAHYFNESIVTAETIIRKEVSRSRTVEVHVVILIPRIV